MENAQAPFQVVQKTLNGLLDTRDLINVERDRLLQSGIFDGLPIESWEQRGSVCNTYLTLVFKSLPNGTHSGPHGKRKLYIGADLTKIENARDQIRRTVEYRKLSGRVDDINRQLWRIEDAVNRATQLCIGMDWHALGMSGNPLDNPLSGKLKLSVGDKSSAPRRPIRPQNPKATKSKVTA
jgi:hypothetical protein